MKKNKRDITEEFFNVFEFVYGWKINKILIASLNRSIQTVNLMVGREAAVNIVWNYLKRNSPIPTKKITDKQKEKLSNQFDRVIARNTLLVEQYRKSMPQDMADAELQSHDYMLRRSVIDGTEFTYEHAPWIPLNDWEELGYFY